MLQCVEEREDESQAGSRDQLSQEMKMINNHLETTNHYHLVLYNKIGLDDNLSITSIDAQQLQSCTVYVDLMSNCTQTVVNISS